MKKIFFLLLIWSTLPIIAQGNKDFNDYLEKFMPCEQKEFDTNFFTMDSVEISKKNVFKFLPKKLNCNCKRVWYRYGKRISLNKYVIVFVSKLCEVPCNYEYPYSEDVLIVYSKTGKLIDFAFVSHGSDIHTSNFSGTIHPFRLIVEQGIMNNPEEMNKVISPQCTIQVNEYTIDSKGKIYKRIVQKNIPGNMIYSNTENVRKLVRKK